MKHYKIVREIRTQSGISINESKPMRFADAMSALARSKYYDRESGFLHLKKFVYWFLEGSSLTKVHMVRA